MVTIIAIGHSISYENEQGIASGHSDTALSPAGVEQAQKRRERFRTEHFDAVFASDLRRAYHTGELILGGRGIPLIADARLRECDYGTYTGRPSSEVNAVRSRYITEPFPNGESYQQVMDRMGNFLQDLLLHHNGSRVMLIGHRATYWGLEYWSSDIHLTDLLDRVVPPSPWYYELHKAQR